MKSFRIRDGTSIRSIIFLILIFALFITAAPIVAFAGNTGPDFRPRNSCRQQPTQRANTFSAIRYPLRN